MEWMEAEGGALIVGKVPIVCAGRAGEYEICIQKRPHYCDRGDWIIFVEGVNSDLDGADGFPRYFFGDMAAVKAQMETWVSRRECARRALLSAGRRA